MEVNVWARTKAMAIWTMEIIVITWEATTRLKKTRLRSFVRIVAMSGTRTVVRSITQREMRFIMSSWVRSSKSSTMGSMLIWGCSKVERVDRVLSFEFRFSIKRVYIDRIRFFLKKIAREQASRLPVQNHKTIIILINRFEDNRFTFKF